MKNSIGFKKVAILSCVLTLILSVLTINNAVFAKPKIAYYAYNSEPILDWDPSVEFSNGIIVLNNIYEALLKYDPQIDKFIPVLATDYKKNQNGLVWTFSIRKGVKFHDGTKLDAEAVKFSFERTMKIGKGAAFIWDAVKKIIVVDEYTVKFELKYSAPMDLISSCGYGAFIMSPKAVKSHSGDWLSKGNAVGTGPYTLKKYKMGDEVILSAFKGYWKGWKNNQFDFVVIKRISETSSRRQMLEKGDADFTIHLPSEDIEELKNNPDIIISDNVSFENLLVFLNTQKKPLDNKLVRQAISHAFPYQNVVKYAAGGYATQAKGPIPAGLWGHGANLPQYQYDLAKAKKMLKQAGYPNGGLKLQFTYMSGDEAEKKMAEMFKSELAKINIDLEIRGMPWESQWELAKSSKAENRQDILTMYWWPDLTSPYSWLFNLYHTEESVNYNMSYWGSKEFDELIDRANTVSATNRPYATKLFVKAQKQLIEEAPSIFVYDRKNVCAIHKSFKGYKANPAYPNVVFFYDTYRE